MKLYADCRIDVAYVFVDARRRLSPLVDVRRRA